MIASRQVLTRRHALAGALLLLPAAARAAEWPERPVRMVIPFAPGAGADIVGRTYADELAKALGQPIVVDNKGGAGGLMGTVEGARAAADGYTLLLTSQGTTVFNIGLYKAPGYDPLKDLVPVCVAGILPNVLVVSPANPASDRRRPGGAGARQAGRAHLRLERRRQQPPPLGRDPRAAHRRAPAARALSRRADRGPRGGERRGDDGLLQRADGGGPDQGRQAQGARRHRQGPLGHAARRADHDGGRRADFVVATWLGFAVPTNTPGAIVTRLNAEINRIGQIPQIKEKLLVQGFEMLPPDSPEAARKLIEDDQAVWLPIIKQSGAMAE